MSHLFHASGDTGIYGGGRRRTEMLLRKAVERAENLDSGIADHQGGADSSAAAWWLGQLSQTRNSTMEVGEKLWKRARALKHSLHELKAASKPGDLVSAKTPTEWVNDAAWQTMLDMYLFLAETNSAFSTRTMRNAARLLSSMPPCAFFGELGATHKETLVGFAEFLIETLSTSCGLETPSKQLEPHQEAVVCAVVELAVVRGSLSFTLAVVLRMVQGKIPLPTKVARAFQRVADTSIPKGDASLIPSQWEQDAAQVASRCIDQSDALLDSATVLALLAPLQKLARRIPKLRKKSLVAGCVEANLEVISQLHLLLLTVIKEPPSEVQGVCVCIILHLLQLNLECLPLPDLSSKPQGGDADDKKSDLDTLRYTLLSTLNQISVGEGQLGGMLHAKTRQAAGLVAQDCIAAGLSFFFQTHAEKIEAIISRMHSSLHQPTGQDPAAPSSSSSPPLAPMLQHPPEVVDMITGLLLDDVARPEMLSELFMSSMLQDLEQQMAEQDAHTDGDAVEPLNNETNFEGRGAALTVPGPELDRMERRSNPASIGFAGLMEPVQVNAAAEGEQKGAAPSAIKTGFGAGTACANMEDLLLKLLSSLAAHELRQTDWWLGSACEPPSLPCADLSGSLDHVLNSTRLEEEWVWDKFHATSMELSEDGCTIKKINDFPDFSNAMGSVWFSSGQHEWELKMGSVSRMWVGVAGKEHFELGEHPTCFRDVWLISSFGGRHPDSTGFGGSLSLEMMFTTGDVIGLHLDMDEGVLSFTKNGTPCSNAKLTGLQGKVLCPVVCMDNAGDSVAILSRNTVMYNVDRKAISVHSAFHSLLMQTVAMMVQVGGDTAEELAQEGGFGVRLLHLGLQYAQDMLAKFSLALERGAGEEAVMAALERSSLKDLLPCLESLTWGLLTGLEAAPSAGGGAGAPPPATPRAVTTATMQELEKVYNSVCALVGSCTSMHGVMTTSRGGGAPGGDQDASAPNSEKPRDKQEGGSARGKGKMVCVDSDYDFYRTQTFAANMQEDLSGAQVVRMTLREDAAESDASRGSRAQHGQMEASNASLDAEWGWTGDGSLAEGMCKEVCLPEANYLLIEFDATECELDARMSLVVTSAEGTCVAQLTGPPCCWPKRHILVSGSECRFQIRSPCGRRGRLSALVTGYLAPPCPSPRQGCQVQPVCAAMPLASTREVRLALRMEDLRACLGGDPSRSLLPELAGAGLQPSPTPNAPDISPMTLCLVELGVKCVLHQIIQGLVRDTEHALPSTPRPTVLNPPGAAISAEAGQAAALVTPEMVERVLRRVLPQSLHRPALEECLACQRAHQLLLHSAVSRRLISHPPSRPWGAPAFGGTPALHQAMHQTVNQAGASGAGPSFATNLGAERDVGSHGAESGRAAADMRMGLMASPSELGVPEFAQVVSVQEVAGWCQTVCSGFAFQSEVFLHFKAIVQHVAVALIKLGMKVANSGDRDNDSDDGLEGVPLSPKMIQPEHVQRGLQGTALGAFLLPIMNHHEVGDRGKHQPLAQFDSDNLVAKWYPPRLPPHWLPHHGPMLAGLAGSVSAHLLKAAPLPTGGPRGAEHACVELLGLWPFNGGVSLDEEAAHAMLMPSIEELVVPAAEVAADDTSDWPSVLAKWSNAAAGTMATQELRLALRAVAFTMGVLSGVKLHALQRPKRLKAVERVFTQHLSSIKGELMGMKLQLHLSYREVLSRVTTTCVALLRFAPNVPSSRQAASAPVGITPFDNPSEQINSDTVNISQSNQQHHRKEELQYLLGRIRHAIIAQLGPKLLSLARSAEQATSAAHESLTGIMRMISWQLDHSQTAVDALLAAWPPNVHYMSVAQGASREGKERLREAAHGLLQSVVNILSSECDGKALEGTLVQVLLRRLDAVDISFLVDQTSLLLVLEHQLAIAGARINGGGDVGLRMWRLLMVLVLHLGTEGHLMATRTVHRVLSSVRVIIGCALDQMYLGAANSLARGSQPSSLAPSNRPISEPVDNQFQSGKEVEGVACINRLEVSSGESLMDSLMDLQHDTAWMPQDHNPSITVHVAPGLGLNRVWLWIPTDRDGSRQSTEVEVVGGASTSALQPLIKRTFASAEEARSAFQPSTVPGVGGDFFLLVDALHTAAMATARVVQLRFKQPLLNRVFSLSMAEEEMYRLKIYGLRLTALPVTPPAPRSGAGSQLVSLVEVCGHLQEVLRESKGVRAAARAAGQDWLRLFLRALRSPAHALGAHSAGAGYLSTHALRLKVVELLPFVLRGQAPEPQLRAAFRSLLETVLQCSPEALLLPSLDQADAFPPEPYQQQEALQLRSAPTLKLRQALVAMLRRQALGADASPAAIEVLCDCLKGACKGTPAAEARAVRTALPAILVLGGFTEGLLRPVPEQDTAASTTSRCTTLACSELILDQKAEEATSKLGASRVQQVDAHLIKVFLDMCERGFTEKEPDSPAQLFLRSRAAKAMWELISLPEFAADLVARKGLLRTLFRLASKLTKVPLDSCVESLAARSIALCGFSAHPLSHTAALAKGKGDTDAVRNNLEPNPQDKVQQRQEHADDVLIATDPTDVPLDIEEHILEQLALDLDASLLLQATSEPEVLMADEREGNSAASALEAGGGGAGGGSGSPTSWLEQAVQAVPLHISSPKEMLTDLSATEDALLVYYSRLVLLQLIQQDPDVAAELVAMGDVVAMLRPLFVCPQESLIGVLPSRCPRPLAHARDGAMRTLRAAEAAFAVWARVAMQRPEPAASSALHELQGACLREVHLLRPPKGAGMDECIHSVIVESPHEYKNRTLFARKLTIPEACSLQITFDPRCSTEKKCDYLAFYSHEEDWRNSKPPLRTCDGPPGSSGWKSPLVVKGAALVYAFQSDKRNTDWGYRFTVQGLNKRNEPRPTRSFILEGVHPGKERNFSGSETLHVRVGPTGKVTPPRLQLQFHPTCTVEKPDQQLVIADVLYSGAVGSATWPTSAHVAGGELDCSFTCTKQKSCVFKWRVAVQPSYMPVPGNRIQLTEAAAAPPLVTGAPFVQFLLRNLLVLFNSQSVANADAPSNSTSSTVGLTLMQARLSALRVLGGKLPWGQQPNPPAIKHQLGHFFRCVAIRLSSLVLDPKLAPCMHTHLLRSLSRLLRLGSNCTPGGIPMLAEPVATAVSRALWGAAAVQYAVEHRSIGTHTCFASPLLSALCEAACVSAGDFGLPRDEPPGAAVSSTGVGRMLSGPSASSWEEGRHAAGSGGRAGQSQRLSAPSSIAEAVEEARSQYLHCRQYLYCRLWELMKSMSAGSALPQWVREEVLRSLRKGDTSAWALPVFERGGEGCTMTSHSVTFTRRCTVLCNRPMNRYTGLYTCEFKIDEGRQILVGIAVPDAHMDTYLGDDPVKLAWGYMNSGRVRSLSTWTSHRLDTFDEGDIITVRLDTNLAKLSFCKNGAPVGIEETVTQWPMVFAAGGSRMGAATITNATNEGMGSVNADSGAVGGLISNLNSGARSSRLGSAAGGGSRRSVGKTTGTLLDKYLTGTSPTSEAPSYLTSPLAMMDNTDGWTLYADAQLLAYAAERAAEKKVGLMQLNPEDLFDVHPDPPAEPHPATTSATVRPSAGAGEGAVIQDAGGSSSLQRWGSGGGGAGGAGAGGAGYSRTPFSPQAAPLLESSASRRMRRSVSAQISAANRFVSLADRPQEALKARFAVLQLYNNLCRVCFPLLAGSWLGTEMHKAKVRLFPETKAQCHDLALSLTALSGTVPSVSINRARATAGRSRKHTVFRQLFDKLGAHSMRTAQHTSMLWHVSFEGEGGIDQGGLFRESLMEMSKELHSDAMPLFVECPNKRRSMGINMDKWVPNPACTSRQEMQMYRFLGAVMGGVMRTKNVLALDLPPIFWKQVLGEPTSVADLAKIDEHQVRLLDRVRGVEDVEAWNKLVGNTPYYFVVEDARGHLRVLRAQHNAPATVRFEDREAFCQEATQFRLNEFHAQVAAIREGLLKSVPELVLSLMTWRELEMAVCGKPEISIEVLKQMTTMNLPSTSNLPGWFWSVLHSFTNKDRAAFLAFACGRSRLPTRGSGTLLTVNLDRTKGDAHCPTSHTCSLTIDLPLYSSEEVLRERLIYAIHNCREIDTDFAARDFGASGELLMELYNVDEEDEEEEMEELEPHDWDPQYSSGFQTFGMSMHEMESRAREASAANSSSRSLSRVETDRDDIHRATTLDPANTVSSHAPMEDFSDEDEDDSQGSGRVRADHEVHLESFQGAQESATGVRRGQRRNIPGFETEHAWFHSFSGRAAGSREELRFLDRNESAGSMGMEMESLFSRAYSEDDNDPGSGSDGYMSADGMGYGMGTREALGQDLSVERDSTGAQEPQTDGIFSTIGGDGRRVRRRATAFDALAMARYTATGGNAEEVDSRTHGDHTSVPSHGDSS